MKRVVFLAAGLISLFLFTSAVFAHDGQWGDADNPIDMNWAAQDFDHQDADPFKGWAILYVKNICGGSWGDFHFQIKSKYGSNIENVDFDVTPAPQLWVLHTSPFSWEQVPLTWNVNNNVVGATLDLYFYNDPLNSGDIAFFKVYTDNTLSPHAAWFTIAANPTPVPEPVTAALLGLGALALLRKRK